MKAMDAIGVAGAVLGMLGLTALMDLGANLLSWKAGGWTFGFRSGAGADGLPGPGLLDLLHAVGWTNDLAIAASAAAAVPAGLLAVWVADRA